MFAQMSELLFRSSGKIEIGNYYNVGQCLVDKRKGYLLQKAPHKRKSVALLK